MIGLFVLMSGFLWLLGSARPTVTQWLRSAHANVAEVQVAKTSWPPYLAAGLVFLLVGASIPLSEMVFPKRYPPVGQQALIDQLVASPALQQSQLDAACLEAVIRDNGLAASNGMALSPRYYDVGEGEATAKLGFAESDEARLVFLITGNRYGLILIHLDEAPAFFPHAADVVAFTDPEASHKAWFVLVRKDDTERIYVSDQIRAVDRCGQVQ
jgi:hypothetical protein